MKKYLLFAALVISICSSAQWTQHSFSTTADLRCVQMLSPTVGYLAGQKFAQTLNAGLTWTTIGSTPMATFSGYGMYFFDANTGVVSGHNYTTFPGTEEIQITYNAGSSWTLAYTGSNTIKNLNFVSATTGFALELPNKILTTTSAGASWLVAYTFATATVNGISFVSNNTGYAACNNGINKTTNGGSTWTNVFPNHAFSVVKFLNDTLGYAMGGDTIYKTANGGQTWSSILLPSAYSTSTIYFSSIDTGYICQYTTSGDYLLRTTNGGLSWEKQYYTGGYQLNDISFYGGSGVAVGNSRSIITTSNAGGSSYPIARFVNTATTCDSLLNLLNQSYTGYTFSWYYNGTVFSNSYSTTHVNPVGSSSHADTVKLVVSNGQHTDSQTIYIYPHSIPADPRLNRFTFSSDTMCPNRYYYATIDSPINSARYELFMNGVKVDSFAFITSGGRYLQAPYVVLDSTRIVVRSTSYSACYTRVDSLVRILRVPKLDPRQNASPVDSIICLHTPATVRLSHTSPFFKYHGYFAYNHNDTVVGNAGSDVFLVDTFYSTPYDTAFSVYMEAFSILGCPTITLPSVMFHIRQPNVSFELSDSMVFVGDTIHITNHSQGDSYQWTFDNTANRLSDTSTNTSVVYRSTGDKPIRLVANTIQHCTNGTLSRSVFVGVHVPSDSVGSICLNTGPDTSIHVLNSGITAFHVDRFGNRYEAGYEYWQGGGGYTESYGAYLVKTDNSGHKIWIKQVPFNLRNNPGFYTGVISAISSDPNGNVYISGTFGTKNYFQFDTLRTSYIFAGSLNDPINYFLAKFDSVGADKWMTYSGGLNTSFQSVGRGASDIKYVDDEHIYALVLYSGDGQTYYTDTSFYQYYGTLTVVQINNKGQYRGSFAATDHTNWGGDVHEALIAPSNSWAADLLHFALGPKLYVHHDCGLSVVGTFHDSMSFPGLHDIKSFGRKSVFVATLDPTVGWTSAYTLFGASTLNMVTGGSIANIAARPITTAGAVPRFDFDRQHNLYISAIVDTLLLSDSLGHPFSAHYYDIQRYYRYPRIIAKFDASGRKVWSTQSMAYNSVPFVSGVNLTQDESKIILTGNYSDGVNLSSVSGPPVLMHTGQPIGNYVAEMDTAGNIHWVRNIQNPSVFEYIFSTKACNGNIYTLATDSANRECHITYNLNGTCGVSDTCPAPVPGQCASVSIALTSGANPACAGTQWQFTATSLSASGTVAYQWYVDSIAAGSNSTVFSTVWLRRGQVVSCVMTVNGIHYSSNTIVMNVWTTDTPIISRSQLTLSSTPHTTYQWYLNSNAVAGANQQTVAITQNGSYTVVTTDSNGCTATSMPYLVTNVGIDMIHTGLNARIYPVPSHGRFYVELSDADDAELRVYDMYGALVREQKLISTREVIDMSAMPVGVYMAVVKNNSGRQTIKLEIN